jgi:hypothetical protein
MKKTSLFFATVLLSLCGWSQDIQSPDKQLQLHFEVKDSVAYYRLDYKNIPVVKQSKLVSHL